MVCSPLTSCQSSMDTSIAGSSDLGAFVGSLAGGQYAAEKGGQFLTDLVVSLRRKWVFSFGE